MILQALNRYYDHLVEDNRLERPGWQPVKVSYALQIDDEGRLVRVLPLFHEVPRGKKNVLTPQEMNLPAQLKKSGINPPSNFLCENAAFMLGINAQHDLDWAKKRFDNCKACHKSLLESVDIPAAQAVVRFFEQWEPADAKCCDAIQPFIDDFASGGNIVFVYNGNYVHDYYEVQQAWDDHYSRSDGGERMRCLVTGEMTDIARLHPSIKGVAGGQASGTSLVSFNAAAFESFGRDGGQGMNAPVSEKAAFAYGAALNYMISEPKCHLRLGDATVVFWAEDAGEAYAACFAAMMGQESPLSDDDLLQVMKNLASGRSVSWDGDALNPDERFYILGLAPNAGRLSVRYFMQDSFGRFVENLRAHHERLEIVRPGYDARASLSFWDLLKETVNPNARDKTPSPLLSGALARSALLGLPYPALLLDQVELRIRAEHRVTRGRAAIIKAFLLNNAQNTERYDEYKEALDVELNENTTYQPYLLGRLFAVLEGLQQAANPGINTTIRDRFFNSACATPGVVFPQLIKLAQAHLKKLDGGLSTYYNRLLGELLSRFNSDYPARLSLYDQGIFQLGYYHQVQSRYAKKEEN